MNVPEALVYGLVGTVTSMLLAGNIYFIKRLIDKVERSLFVELEIKVKSAELHEKLEKLGKDLNGVADSMRSSKTSFEKTIGELRAEMKDEFKHFRQVEIDLGIIKAHVEIPKSGKGRDG